MIRNDYHIDKLFTITHKFWINQKMFRKKQKEYIKNSEKIQSIISTNPPVHESDKQNHTQKLNQKYRAYTSLPNRSINLSIANPNLDPSEVKADSFLKKCHIIDSPDVVFRAFEFLQDNKRSSFDQKDKTKQVQLIPGGGNSIKHRFKEQISQRRQFRKLINQMKQQMQVVGQANMQATDIFIYKQQLLNLYFQKVLAQLGKQCKEKALSIQILWNSMIDLMERMFKIILNRIQQEDNTKFQNFQNYHEEINNNIQKVSQQTYKLKQKLDLKNNLIYEIEKKMEDQKKKIEANRNYKKTDNTNKQIQQSQKTATYIDFGMQTILIREKQAPRKIFQSIGITVKQSKFLRTVSTQSNKQLKFDIKCIQLTIISEKPRKTAFQERETTKVTQTQSLKTQQQYSQTQNTCTSPIQTRVRAGFIRKSTVLDKPIFVGDKSIILQKKTQIQKQNQQNTSSQSQKSEKKQTIRKSTKKISKQENLIKKQLIKTLKKQNSKNQQNSQIDNYLEVHIPKLQNSTKSYLSKNIRSRNSSATHVLTKLNNIQSEDKSPSRKSIFIPSKKQRNKARQTLSTYSLTKQILKTQPNQILSASNNIDTKSSDGKRKMIKSIDEQVQSIIQTHVRCQSQQKIKQTNLKIRQSIYSSFLKRVSVSKKSVGMEKNTNICRIISELYQMAYQKIARGRQIEFVDTIFDYFTISYGAHNKNFVIDKVSSFLAEAKQLQSTNIHIQLFCLLAKLTKYPDVDDLQSQDFELCIKLLTQLNCDKKGFNVQSNFTTVQKLNSICQPLVAKCIGTAKANEINRTMEWLISKSLGSQDEKDVYRVSVSSTILFVLNRIVEQRSSFCSQVKKLVQILRIPKSKEIEVKVIDVLLKYLNISKKLFITSSIKLKNALQSKSQMKLSSFVSSLMKIDYPLPSNTSKYLNQRYRIQLRKFQSNQTEIEYLSKLSLNVLPILSQYICQNLRENPSSEELECLQEILIFHKLEQQATKILGQVIGKELECVFYFCLELLVNE